MVAPSGPLVFPTSDLPLSSLLPRWSHCLRSMSPVCCRSMDLSPVNASILPSPDVIANETYSTETYLVATITFDIPDCPSGYRVHQVLGYTSSLLCSVLPTIITQTSGNTVAECATIGIGMSVGILVIVVVFWYRDSSHRCTERPCRKKQPHRSFDDFNDGDLQPQCRKRGWFREMKLC